MSSRRALPWCLEIYVFVDCSFQHSFDLIMLNSEKVEPKGSINL